MIQIKNFIEFINESKNLKSVNLKVLNNVIKTLKEENVTEFRTQNDFFVFLEIHKYPHLNSRKTEIVGPDKSHKIFYTPNNYSTIIEWLENNNIITYEQNSKNKKVIINQIQLKKINNNV